MTYRGKVGLGLTTWKRPALYRQSMASVVGHLSGVVDVGIVIQDGGECYVEDLPEGWWLSDHGENRGWAESKNEGLSFLLSQGCDHLFMIEDDTTVTSPRAVTGYVDAAIASGWHYLTAHPWGETTTALVEQDGPISYWAYVGSWWTYMSRHGFLEGGGYNEYMGGIMGDIELPQRWKLKGLSSGWGKLADATGSEDWVKPSCLTPDQSTICTQPGWAERQWHLIEWWAETMPETMPAEIRPCREGRPSRRCLPAEY